ncbi:DNRLRE domain-containing protein [Paenibacillus mucilaginosus]|uniref:CBM6 domain-containing protein n=2 Tax=Paenibacillus mucilaginosus TaxID=61624 RepID=F8FPN0_PAEMK|nr:hypothetical protein KNP414_01692 [Paenibacillus mucilaginosus KNP414]WDM29472.1 DNRLRE domain-containing protein [Paenibacillus mucilaginosus]
MKKAAGRMGCNLRRVITQQSENAYFVLRVNDYFHIRRFSMTKKGTKTQKSVILGMCAVLLPTIFLPVNTQPAAGAAAVLNLNPAADSYVSSEAAAVNYGKAASMVTKQAAVNERSAYLKFDLSGITGTITSAKLKLYVKNRSASVSRSVYAVSTDNWTENGLTYSSRPPYGSQVGAAVITSPGWVEFDVTPYIKGEHAGDKTASLYIKDPVLSSDAGIEFYSKENGTNIPVLAVTTGTASTAPAPFVHPGGLYKQSDLDRMKYMVQAGVEPYLTSFNELKADAKSSYLYTVKGDPSWTSVNRGGLHGSEFESDVTAAYLNALMWAITGDARHADKAVQIFNTWSSLTEVTGGGTEALNAGLFAWKLVEAAEIIKSTYSGWVPADLQKFKDMLVYPGYSTTGVPSSVTQNNGTFYWRIYNGDPGRHGNQDLLAWRAMISMGVFLDNRTMYDRALRYFKGLPHRPDDLPYTPGPSTSGTQLGTNMYFDTFQANRQSTTADWGYNGVLQHYIWENGQNQESSRDQQHAFLGVGTAAGIAEVAWNQGDDVWNSLDNRLLKGFEFMAKYNTSYIASFPDQPGPWEPDNFIQRTDRTGRWFSKMMNPHFESDFVRVSRGDFPGKRPVYEQAVAHFQVRMGQGSLAPWTERSRDVAISKSGYEKTGFSLDHPGWGALTFRRPPGAAGDPVKGFAGGVPSFGVHVLPGTVEAENYDHFPASGEGRTYHDLSAGNSSGQYRSDSVDIQSVSTGGYALTDLDAGEWYTYTVFVPVTGKYKVRVSYASPSGGGAVKFAFNGTDAGSPTALPATGSWTAWSAHTAADQVQLSAGVQTMRVYVGGTSDKFVLDRIQIEAVN